MPTIINAKQKGSEQRCNDEQLLFSVDNDTETDGEKRPPAPQLEPWKVVVIDDEEVVHSVSKMVLNNFTFQDRPLELLHAYSGSEGREVLKSNPDAAVLLLDVVMETDDAGLQLVSHIRKELNNKLLRIILRTGQPGQAPEQKVITQYDINDYKDKSELTAQKLITTVVSSLRAYDDLKTIQTLASSNETLEALVSERTQELDERNKELHQQVEERIKAIAALEESESRLEEAQRIANIGSFSWDLDKDEITCSRQLAEILRLDSDTLPIREKDFFQLVDDNELDLVRHQMENAIANKSPYQVQHKLVLGGGIVKYVHQHGEPVVSGDGGVHKLVGIVQDVTVRRKVEETMRQLSAAVEQTADAVMITDNEGRIQYVNPAFTSVTGYTKAEVVGQTPKILRSEQQSDAFYKRMWSTIMRGEVFSDVIINRRKNGSFYYEEKTITPLRNDNGEITHFISSGKNVTERMEAQRRLHHLAHHDALTGLPNRILLQDRLDQALARMRWKDRKIAVLFIDLDRFKVINDTLGHSYGDELLKSIATILTDCVREGDSVSRLGGDEFAIILNDVADTHDIDPIAQKILESLTQPLSIFSRELFVTASIGISLFPQNGGDSQTLLKKADVAMYHAKDLGKNNFQYYTEEDDAKAVERLTLETGLRRALDKQEFYLNFQPQLNLKTWKVDSFEALLRWEHPEFGTVGPTQFIPLLEETGLIVEVGDWVVRAACAHEKARQDRGEAPCRIAVNISFLQFRINNFADKVKQALEHSGLDARYLELEITEGVLVEDADEAAAILRELHALGVRLAIDDFGTGYSSMNYLKRLPFDSLKIDRSFVSDITNNQDDAAIASGIISLAHTMGLEVIAEGVETHEQLNMLYDEGCGYIQGYLCSPPLPATAVEKVRLKDHKLLNKLKPK